MAIQLLDRRDFEDKLAVPWVLVKRRLPNAYYIASETIMDGDKRGMLLLRVAEKASQERVAGLQRMRIDQVGADYGKEKM